MSKKSYSPAHPGYWKKRIYRLSRKVNGQVIESPYWSIKLQYDGKREVFNLGTADAKVAAVKAKDIALCLSANGWDETKRRYKRKGLAVAQDGTVGAFLAAQRARSGLKPGTFKVYAERLRQIVSWAAQIPLVLSRFNYVNGGTAAWVAQVESQPLSVLSRDKVWAWQINYIARKGLNPVKRASAERSAASVIRCARSLFRDHPASPFDGVKIKTVRTERYRTAVEPAELLRLADEELRKHRGQEYLALCLCLFAGLRKKEADLLCWEQVDLERGIIKVVRTAYFSPKTEESQREIDVSFLLVALLAEEKQRRNGIFVLEGNPPKPNALYNYYRAKRTWKKLHAWLKSKGVTERKAIHALRKESGSVIADRYGIEAARAHLGHRNIQTTSAFYVVKKSRREFSLSPAEPAGAPASSPAESARLP